MVFKIAMDVKRFEGSIQNDSLTFLSHFSCVLITEIHDSVATILGNFKCKSAAGIHFYWLSNKTNKQTNKP